MADFGIGQDQMASVISSFLSFTQNEGSDLKGVKGNQSVQSSRVRSSDEGLSRGQISELDDSVCQPGSSPLGNMTKTKMESLPRMNTIGRQKRFLVLTKIKMAS